MPELAQRFLAFYMLLLPLFFVIVEGVSTGFAIVTNPSRRRDAFERDTLNMECANTLGTAKELVVLSTAAYVAPPPLPRLRNKK
jgi:hypothetical protein